MSGLRPDVRDQARAAVRGLSSPAADPGFRERLGRRFAEGDLPPAERPHATRVLPWLAAAAVLAVVATFLLFTERGPSWQVASAWAEGTVEIDGVVVPRLPRSFGRRGAVSEFVSGETRVTSGAGFGGARLRFRTPEAHVEVTGTTLAVIRDSVATCVCVFEGTVSIGTRPDALAPVEA